MIKEFVEFLKRGNVIDLAVAVILGNAFGAIVSALVDNIFMPIIGILIGGVDFSSLALQVGGAKLEYGIFIQNLVNFIIIAFVLFLVVRSYNSIKTRWQREEKKEEAGPSEEVALLTEIRDLLRAQQNPTGRNRLI